MFEVRTVKKEGEIIFADGAQVGIGETYNYDIFLSVD
jgi:hypothetical protein